MKRILPDLHYFTGLRVGRVYLIEDQDGLTVVDAGIGSAADKIVAQLQAAEHRPRDVRRILVTHAHPDHVGGLCRLQELTGARVIAPAVERAVIEGSEPTPVTPPERLSGIARWLGRPGTQLDATRVDQAVDEGDRLPEVMGGLRVIATPGHSPGHVAYWQPQRRILFCGDVVVNWLGLRLPFGVVTFDMAQNKRSLARLVALRPDVVCFGHGPPRTEQAAERLRAFARKVGAI